MLLAQLLAPVLGALPLLPGALAVPQYGYEGYQGKGPSRQCQDAGGGKAEYENVTMIYDYYEPELVTAAACESPCSITKSYTWTKGSIASLGGSVGAPGIAESLWKWLAGSSINAGYSWTYSESESTSPSLQCDLQERGIRCGVHVIPRMVNTTGHFRYSLGNSPACNNLGGWKSFWVVAPATKTTWKNAQVDSGKGEADDIDVTFGSCIAYCYNIESCHKAVKLGMKACPQADINEEWLRVQGDDAKDFSRWLEGLNGHEEVVVGDKAVDAAVGGIGGLAGIALDVAGDLTAE